MVPWPALERLGGVSHDPSAERRRWGGLYAALNLITILAAALLALAYELLEARGDAWVAVIVASGAAMALLFFRFTRDTELAKRFVLTLFLFVFAGSAVVLGEISYLAWVAVMMAMSFLVGGLAIGVGSALVMGAVLLGAGIHLALNGVDPTPVSDAVRLLRIASLAPVLAAYGYIYELARTRNAAALEAARAAAHRSNEAKGRLLSKVSHEIRTPLNGVLGLTRSLLSREDLPGQVIEDLQLIEQSGEGLLALINDLLDISRAEAGKVELHPTAVDLGKLLADLTGLYRDAAAQKRLTLHVENECRESVWVLVDESRLRQIIGNLLSNALKFTSAGSVVVRLRCGESTGGRVETSISIEDTGAGLDPEELAQVFEPFRQFHTHLAQGGTGLGLAISKELARCMGGRLEATSTKGKGSCFSLQLPLERASMPRQPERGPAKLPPFTALIVDDNAINRRVASAFVTLLGGTPTEADDGFVALEFASKQRFDLVLMDLQMPGLDGLQTFAALKEKGITTPVLAVTGTAEPETQEECLRAGMVGVLVKPVQLATFRAELERVLSLRAPRGATPRS
jgi:signal transduction histidine kinase/ActR/RegA family two-component response regulator